MTSLVFNISSILSSLNIYLERRRPLNGRIPFASHLQNFVHKHTNTHARTHAHKLHRLDMFTRIFYTTTSEIHIEARLDIFWKVTCSVILVGNKIKSDPLLCCWPPCKNDEDHRWGAFIILFKRRNTKVMNSFMTKRIEQLNKTVHSSTANGKIEAHIRTNKSFSHKSIVLKLHPPC